MWHRIFYYDKQIWFKYQESHESHGLSRLLISMANQSTNLLFVSNFPVFPL